MAKLSGVYIIQSILFPNRIYVGSSHDINGRKSVHFYQLKNNTHSNSKLQNHYNKYGVNDLVFEIIECGDYVEKNHLLAREQGWYYHFKYGKRDLPYFNHRPIAESNYGVKQSKERVERKRREMKALWSDPVFYDKMMQSFSNKIVSDESKESQRQAMKDLWANPEFREKQLSLLRENPWMKGKKHSPETMEKIKETKSSPEYIQKVSLMMSQKWEDPISGERLLNGVRNRPDKICEHCGKVCKAIDYGMHHGDKCKDKPLLNYDDCLWGQITVSKTEH